MGGHAINNSPGLIRKITVSLDWATDLSGLPATWKVFTKDFAPVLPANARLVGISIGEGGTFVGFQDVGDTATALVTVFDPPPTQSSLGDRDVRVGQGPFPLSVVPSSVGWVMSPLSAGAAGLAITSDQDLNTFTAGHVDVALFYVVAP
jgi:hypothetical protein